MNGVEREGVGVGTFSSTKNHHYSSADVPRSYRFNYKRPFDSNLNIKKDLCGPGRGSGIEVKEKTSPEEDSRRRCFRFITVNGKFSSRQRHRAKITKVTALNIIYIRPEIYKPIEINNRNCFFDIENRNLGIRCVFRRVRTVLMAVTCFTYSIECTNKVNKIYTFF